MNEKTRRNFFADAAAASAVLLGGCNRPVSTEAAGGGSERAAASGPADVTLRIGTVLADIAKDHTISTIGYNGSVAGPLIRLREGVPVTVEIFNDTDTSELVHWHGQIIPASIDGAAEEKSLEVPAHGHIRYQLIPQPAGARFVHTHVMSMADLNRGTYTGQFAFVYIEPKSNPGHYDQEVFLAAHEFEPFFGAEEMEEGGEKDAETARKTKEAQQKQEKPNGWEIGYQRFTINGKCLGYGEPVRPFPERECDREHSARFARSPVSGCRSRRKSRASTAIGGCARIGHRRTNIRRGRNEESWCLGPRYAEG